MFYFNTNKFLFYFILIFKSLQSSVSHDLSEIILTCWFTAQDTFLIIINVENICSKKLILSFSKDALAYINHKWQ